MNEQGITDFLRDGNGNPVQSRLDDTTLTAIAQATHGSYRPLGNLGEGLSEVRRLVENSASTHDDARMRKLGVDRFHVPVAAVLFLLVVESLVGTRRRVVQNRA
jgi:Ca-activated chloride channel family protein